MLRLFVAALVLSVASPACWSGDDAATDDEIVDECLADAGIGDDLGNLDFRRQEDPAFDAALVACFQSIGVDLPAPGELTRAIDEVLLAEIGCLRDKGWDVPDPQRGEEGALNMGRLNDFVADDQMAAFDADDAACMAEIAPPGKKFPVGGGKED